MVCSIPQYSLPSKPIAGPFAPGLDLFRGWVVRVRGVELTGRDKA